jgi:environmental stress-induced protein Ves
MTADAAEEATPGRRQDPGPTPGSLVVWRAAERSRSEWKNGGGTTAQVAGAPDGAGLDDFDWRVSVADVREGGPFSTFDGVQRVIVLLDGPAMDLDVDGVAHRLLPHQPFPFAGESDTVCTLPAGPTRDLNVMTRRGRFRAAVAILTLPATDEPVHVPGADPLLLVALAGAVHVAQADGASIRLAGLDAASSDDPAGLTIGGNGVLAIVRLEPVDEAPPSS